MIRRLALLAAMLTTAPSELRAQNLPEPLRRMSSMIAGLQRYGLIVTVRVVDSVGRVLLARQMHVARDTNRYLYRFDSTVALLTPSATVLIDHARRTIAYSPSKAQLGEQALPIIAADSALRGLDSVRALSSTPAGSRYRIFVHQGPILRADVLVDDVTHLLRELTYSYLTGESGEASVIIRYDWDFARLDDDSLRIERYLRVRPDTIEPVGELRGYKIVRGK